MRKTVLAALLGAMALSGCVAVTVVDTTVGIVGSAVETTVDVTGVVVGGTVDLVTGDDESGTE